MPMPCASAQGIGAVMELGGARECWRRGFGRGGRRDGSDGDRHGGRHREDITDSKSDSSANAPGIRRIGDENSEPVTVAISSALRTSHITSIDSLLAVAWFRLN